MHKSDDGHDVLDDGTTFLLGRVRRLERTNRVICGVATAALVLVLVSGARSPDPGKLDTQQLTIRDKQGVARAVLGVDEGGSARFDLADPKGRQCLGLAVGPDGTIGIEVHDSQGADKLFLGVMPDGKVALTMFDHGGGQHANDGAKPAFGAGVEADGTVGLTVLGRDGRNLRVMSRPGREAAFTAFGTDLKNYASLGFMPDGGMNLNFRKEGKDVLRAVSPKSGEGYLTFHDGTGSPRMEIGSGPKGAAGTYIRNAKGEVRAVFDVKSDGWPRFILYDQEGNGLMELPPRPLVAH